MITIEYQGHGMVCGTWFVKKGSVNMGQVITWWDDGKDAQVLAYYMGEMGDVESTFGGPHEIKPTMVLEIGRAVYADQKEMHYITTLVNLGPG